MLNRSIVHTILFAGALTACQTMHSAAGPKLSTWWQSATNRAAFVLPYYYNPSSRATQKNYYIFGKEKGGPDKGTYSPFGGKAQPGEGHPVVTAAREAVEELSSQRTFNFNQQQMQNHIDLPKGNTIYIVAQSSGVGGRNVAAIYLTGFSEPQIKQQLLKNFKGNREIADLAEVRADRLWDALKSAQPNRPIKVEATVWVNGQRVGNQTITLRPIAFRLKPWANGDLGTIGQDNRIHFYN